MRERYQVISDRVPRPFVPGPDQRENQERAPVAGHELGHADSAISIAKVYPDVVSVRPASDGSEGRNTFSSNMAVRDSQIVAAGGSVDTTFGAAEGYGSDMGRVAMLHAFGGGIPPDAAHASAKAVVELRSFGEREAAAEVLAHEGEVAGADVPEIFERGAFEAKWESLGYEIVFDENAGEADSREDGGDNWGKVLEFNNDGVAFLKEAA